MLGVGLIHTHLGCPYLLGDCYVEGYPRWLEYIQVALVFYVYGWWAAAAILLPLLFVLPPLVFKARKKESGEEEQ